MKKIAALTLCLLIIFSLTACGGFNERKLIGNWDTEISMEDFMAITGEDDLGLGDDIPEGYIDAIKDVSFKFRLVFYKDGTSETLIPKKSLEQSYDAILNALIDYLKNGGLLEMFKAQGITTQEEMEAALTLIDSSVDDLINQIKTEADKNIEEGKKELVKEYELKDGYYSAGLESFTLEDNKITLTYKEDDEEKKEIMYYEVIDKDTLKVTKMIVDYEELHSEIIFMRVK